MGKVLAGLGVLLLSVLVVGVLFLDSMGTQQACNPAAAIIDPESVPEGPVAGYGNAQLVNAAIIAKVAADRDLPARAQLIGIMTAMGESSLVNVDYGDDINGVVNPDGTATCSLGLFQQQWCLGWGTRDQVMDPAYAAGAFFDRLVKVEGWEDLAPTIAINRIQRNADPFHYAGYETAAGEIIEAIGGARPASCGASGEWVPAVSLDTPGLMISDWFGIRDSTITGKVWLNSGLDLAASTGTPIQAAGAGTVISAVRSDDSDLGLNVKVDHGDGIETWYLHLSEVLVSEGDKVTAGQVIGAMGTTGLSTGTHLHLTTVVDGERVDPIPFMKARGIDYCVLPQSTNPTTTNTCN